MTALRQEAFTILQSVPEENLLEIIRYIQARNLATVSKAERIEKKRIALEELRKLCKPIPDLDYDKAKNEYMEEKFGNANFS